MKTPSKRIVVTSNMDKVGQQTTAGKSKPEAHFRAVIEKAVNTTGQAIYSKSKRK
jgi:hypothetical protein